MSKPQDQRLAICYGMYREHRKKVRRKGQKCAGTKGACGCHECRCADGTCEEILGSRKGQEQPGWSYKYAANAYALDMPVGLDLGNETGSFGAVDVTAILKDGLPAVDEKSMSVGFAFASETCRDRVGDVVRVAGIVTDAHRHSLVSFVDHGKHIHLPIGKTQNPEGQYTVICDPVSGYAVARTFFSQKFLEAQQVFALCVEGILGRTGSIGYRTLRMEKIPADPENGFFKPGLDLISVELLEPSIVGIPTNQDCARKALSGRYDGKSLSEQLRRMIEPYAGPKRHWEHGWRVEVRRKQIIPQTKGDGPHDFSTTQFDFDRAGYSRSEGSPIPAFQELAGSIPDEDLAEDGREKTPHLTVKYGLHTANPEDVAEVVKGFGGVEVTLGQTSLFPANENDSQRGGAQYDVVKLDADGQRLRELNRLLSDSLKHTDTHPTYKPHVTLAYVLPGKGKKYVGRSPLTGRKIIFDTLTFSDQQGKTHAIPLTDDTNARTLSGESMSTSKAKSPPPRKGKDAGAVSPAMSAVDDSAGGTMVGDKEHDDFGYQDAQEPAIPHGAQVRANLHGALMMLHDVLDHIEENDLAGAEPEDRENLSGHLKAIRESMQGHAGPIAEEFAKRYPDLEPLTGHEDEEDAEATRTPEEEEEVGPDEKSWKPWVKELKWKGKGIARRKSAPARTTGAKDMGAQIAEMQKKLDAALSGKGMSKKSMSSIKGAADFLDEHADEENLNHRQKAAVRYHAKELHGLCDAHETKDETPAEMPEDGGMEGGTMGMDEEAMKSVLKSFQTLNSRAEQLEKQLPTLSR